MQRGRQLHAGIEAERSLQLHPRDIKAGDMLQQKEEEDIRQGRVLHRDMEHGTDHQADASGSAGHEGEN